MTIHDDKDTGNASKTGRLVAAVKASIPALAFIVLLVLPSYSMSLPQARAAGPGSLIWSQTSNPSGADDGAYGVAVDGSGVYIVGFDYIPGNAEWRIQKRSLTTGSLIWSQTSNPSSGDDVAYGVAVDGSGVYIVGYDRSPGNGEWRVEKRSLTTGSLIWSQTNNPSTSYDLAFGVAVDGSGVYIVGYDYIPGNAEWRVEKRSLTTGSLIWSQTSNPSALDDAAWGVAVDGSGVYIVGYDRSPGNGEWRVEKRDLGLAGPGYYSVDVYVKDATSGRAIEGAQVFLDGVPRGYSNVMGLLTVVGVGSGTHTATATKTGYSASVETFPVTRATSVSVKMTPIVVTSTVTVQVYDAVTSSPIASAMVYVDGAYAGATDAAGQLVLTLNAGTHTFTVARSGYVTKTQTATWTGSSYTVYIPLARR